MVPEYEARLMNLFRYVPHMTIDNLNVNVNKFLFGLNIKICAKVRILMV
jgi:hypothetical protein